MAKPRKGPKTTYDKVKDLDPNFIEEVYTMRVEALKERIVTLTSHSMEIEEAKSKDTDLKSKQDAAKEAAKTYSEPLAANKLKRRLIIQILNERGQKPEPTV